MEFFLCVIGMVLVVEGMPYFAFPEKMKEFMETIHGQEDATLRIIGGTLIILGLLILLVARKGLGSA
jgi:uncharacterized protein